MKQKLPLIGTATNKMHLYLSPATKNYCLVQNQAGTMKAVVWLCGSKLGTDNESWGTQA